MDHFRSSINVFVYSWHSRMELNSKESKIFFPYLSYLQVHILKTVDHFQDIDFSLFLCVLKLNDTFKFKTHDHICIHIYSWFIGLASIHEWKQVTFDFLSLAYFDVLVSLSEGTKGGQTGKNVREWKILKQPTYKWT
jgi:hypothetical protein